MARLGRRVIGSALIVVGLSGPACAAPGASPREPSVRERLAGMKAAIDAAIGEARAARAEDCRAIPFGSKPCGGPWRYLVYSAAATDVERLESLVADYNAVDKQRNADEGLVSDCMFVGPPAVAIVGGRCTARGQ